MFCFLSKNKEKNKDDLKDHIKFQGNHQFKGFKEIDTCGYDTIDPDYISIICISDSHSRYRGLKNLPKADILIHSGDFTIESSTQEINTFAEFLKNNK